MMDPRPAQAVDGLVERALFADVINALDTLRMETLRAGTAAQKLRFASLIHHWSQMLQLHSHKQSVDE